MKARQEKYVPQAGSGTDTSVGESRPLTVSADRGCPSYSGGGDVLLKWDKPFTRSGLLKRTPPKTTTQACSRIEIEQTETEDGISTGDEGAQCQRATYISPMTFFSPMANTPRNRESKRKKSPTIKESETLEQKENRLLNGLFDNIVVVNSLIDRQGPYKNTANEVKIKLRELQKLCGRVLDVRRMMAEKNDEDTESTPKRAKRVANVEDKGTNTSNGSETEDLECDDKANTETEWKETKSKSRQRKEKKVDEIRDKMEVSLRKENNKKTNKNAQDKINNITSNQRSKLPNRRYMKAGKKATEKPEALLVEVKGRDYASVLKEVKTGLANEDIVFSKVRKTKRGDILLELEKGHSGGASQIKDKVGELYPTLSLRALKESTDVIIKGLDITAEKEEIEESLRQKVKEFRIKRFWENHYGVKSAIIELTKDDALKLLAEKKIKIGWVRVPIVLVEQRRRCYRCLEYGHISTGCPGQDRSKTCFNCGHEGHMAKDCQSETACAICKEKGHPRTNHRIGSKSCPSWKRKVPGIQNRSKNGM